MSSIPRQYFTAVALTVLGFAIPATRAAEPTLPADLALIPADADQFASMRLARLWTSDAFESYRAMVGPHVKEIEEMFGFQPQQIDRLSVFSRGEDTIILVSTTQPANRNTVLAVYATDAPERRVAGKVCFRNEEEWTGVVFLDERTVAFGPVDAVEAFARAAAVKEGPQSSTLRLAAEHDLVIRVPGQGKNGLQAVAGPVLAVLPQLKPVFLAESAVLIADTKPAGTAGTAEELQLRTTFHYGTSVGARDAAQAYRRAAVGELKKWVEDWTSSEPSLREELNPGAAAARLAIRTAQREVRLTREGQDLTAAVVLPARDVGTEALSHCFCSWCATASPRVGSDPHLENLAKAVLAYHKDKGHLPPHALYAKDGKTPLLSWRVLVLPYLGDEGKKLYGQFELDKPWDSEHNIRLVRKMPRLFGGPGTFGGEVGVGTATTEYQLLVGPGTLFEGRKGRPLSDATDGPANTILIAQAFQRVPWTKPQDLVYAPDRPLPRMGNRQGWVSSLTVAFGDGQQRTLVAPGHAQQTENGKHVWKPTEKFDETPLRALITRAGGEKVDRDAVKSNLLPFVAPGGEELQLELPKP